MALPGYLKSSLWSYDLARMDKDEDYRLIIMQILNHGDRRQKKWLEENYRDEKVKEVVTHPARGMWEREVLRYWLGKFDVMIDPLSFDTAIRNLDPRVEIWKAFWGRKEKDGFVPKHFK